MQGQPVSGTGEPAPLGFIPADAGATLNLISALYQVKVHPCGCRGNGDKFRDEWRALGSSLRMQGQQGPGIVRQPVQGFIPADAGATKTPSAVANICRVHPCGCRGNKDDIVWERNQGGSSLRMQGQRQIKPQIAVRLGFIPADAGATQADHVPFERIRVHPCGCRGNTSL